MGKSDKHRTNRQSSQPTKNQKNSTESSTPVSEDEEALAALAKKIQQKKEAKKDRERKETAKRPKKHLLVSQIPPRIHYNIIELIGYIFRKNALISPNQKSQIQRSQIHLSVLLYLCRLRKISLRASTIPNHQYWRILNDLKRYLIYILYSYY